MPAASASATEKGRATNLGDNGRAFDIGTH
jgi:hypothetical protein